MSVAFETVVIVIVVVSFTVLTAIVFALYWLWRLLLEDRRCVLANNRSTMNWNRRASHLPGFAIILPPSSSQNCANDAECTERLTSNHYNDPSIEITRGSELMVDERSFRMTRSKRPSGGQKQKKQTNPSINQPEMIVLDGTEPPPPYEGT